MVFSVQGTLSQDSLPSLFGRLSSNRKTGILHLSNGDVSKRVYFNQGSMVFAGSDESEERLGEYLVRIGKLKRTDLDRALQAVRETGQSLGKTIEEMGLLSPEELKNHARERMKSILFSLLSWQSGEYSFEERDPSVDEEMTLGPSAAEIILEGVRSIDDPNLVRRGLGDLKKVLRQPRNPLNPYQEGSLSSSVEWILYQANGVSTIEEIAAGSPLDENRVLQSIYALVAAGILQIESPDSSPTPAPTETVDVVGDADTHEMGDTPSGRASMASGNFSPASIPKKLGRYEVQGVLGNGAMGVVLLARDPMIDRTVAIKLIQTAIQLGAGQLEQYRERFQREAQAAGKLLHPGIVTVFDVGHLERDIPYIVMEYVEGKTLLEILREEEISQEDAIRIAGEILDALGYAHSQGIVHRDIKPANILVSPDGHAKIMDFGIAHMAGSYTQGQAMIGSLYYMAPEQFSKVTVDQRTDLFSFGVVLYQMLARKLPFAGDTFARVAHATLYEEPTPVRDSNPEVSPALDSLILRCLAKEPDRRFGSADEVKQALGSLDEVEQAPAAGQGQISKDKVERKRSRLSFAAMWILALSGAVLGLFFILPNPWKLPPALPPPHNKTPIDLVTRSPIAVRSPAVKTWGMDVRPAPQEPDLQTEAIPVVQPVTDAELFYEATLTFQGGELTISKSILEALLQRSPEFSGAAELLEQVNDAIWMKTLPLIFGATHNHRIGSCSGRLMLTRHGIRYFSPDHEWHWSFDAIRVLQRADQGILLVETYEKDVIGLGKPKNYKFALDHSLGEKDWERYLRLWKKSS